MKNTTPKLSLTVGITTCYGDVSILETVKSIRSSEGVNDFQFIIIADRVPLTAGIKMELKKYKVQFVENKTEGSQIKKQKQILKLTKTDLLVLTQDDVLLDKKTLVEVVGRFQNHPKTTMVSIRNAPLQPQTFFEATLNIGTNLANKLAKHWNNGDNYLSVIGRFMAFRTETFKKFRMPEEVATSDAFYYFENKRVGGGYEYIPKVRVYFRNPQNMKEHLRKSSRFQYSKMEMAHYFKNLTREYKTPPFVTIQSLIEQLIEAPVYFLFYFVVYLYTRILKLAPKKVLNPVWEVDASTKNITSK